MDTESINFLPFRFQYTGFVFLVVIFFYESSMRANLLARVPGVDHAGSFAEWLLLGRTPEWPRVPSGISSGSNASDCILQAASMRSTLEFFL